MEIIILGSGTCVPSIRRAGPSACLRYGDLTILIDAASGTLKQLLTAGISYDSVDAILFTHIHPDHVGELVPFVFATKYAPGYSRNTPVTILAASGFMDFYRSLSSAFGNWISLDPVSIIIRELPAGRRTETQIPPVVVRTCATLHTPMSLAYRIETPEGKSVVFSGDTDFSEDLIELGRDTDLLICECAAPEGFKVRGHLTPSEAGRIAGQAGAKCLVLTHFYPECDRHDLISPCRRYYQGPLFLAEDLMRLNV
ncbi:MAG TPA: MBL fold metallo-hydrolase [Thermodesulfobacteriaceae bacterium]|nr:MBL fold metallo-hydrolase [Thermodesulfobacteriaceae bacterium]